MENSISNILRCQKHQNSTPGGSHCNRPYNHSPLEGTGYGDGYYVAAVLSICIF